MPARTACLTVLPLLGLAACAAPPEAAAEALWGVDGRLAVQAAGQTVATAGAGLFEPDWQYRSATADRTATVTPPERALRLTTAAGPARATARATETAGGLRLDYTFTPAGPVDLNSLHVSWDLPAGVWRGATWAVGGRRGTLPATPAAEIRLFSGQADTLTITAPDGRSLTITTPRPGPVLLQDNRRWGDSFSIRIGRDGDPAFRWEAPETISMTATWEPTMKLVVDQPVTLQADDEWVPLSDPLDVVPGSALDFRRLGLLDAPAGKHGWLTATPDGHFAFAQRPQQAVRFYGVNFCFGAQYPDHALADRLADRLAALGYNSVRLHHYERDLVRTEGVDTLSFRPEQLDRLDYFVAALKQRGIYLTTDLYVSRPIKPAEVYATGDPVGEYKIQVLINSRARDNLKAFTRALLGHVNPYTKLAWKDDPALCLLSLVNEGNLLNYVGGLQGRLADDFRAQWNRWLLARYGTRAKLAAAWGDALAATEDPAAGTVASRGGNEARTRDFHLHAAALHLAFLTDLKAFLRTEIGTRALVTDLNAWTETWPLMAVREQMDYVDNHSYWDHPNFLEQPWRLPSRGGHQGRSAVVSNGALHTGKALTRLLEKPFAFTEYNYSGPNVYRAESGPLTGGYAAHQGWDAIYRFAYSHGAGNLAEPQAGGYFDLVSDPTTQASDRFAALLFLRDAAPAKATVAVVCPGPGLLESGVRTSLNLPVRELANVVRVAARYQAAATPPPGELALPLAEADRPAAQLLADLRARQLLPADNPTDLAQDVHVSDTGQLRLEPRRGLFCFATPGSVGVFSATGEAGTAGPLAIAPQGGPIGVYVASLGPVEVAAAPRLLVAHVADVQATGRRFGERARQTTLAWGTMPYLVQDRTTRIALRLAEPGGYAVHALAGDGRRLAELPAAVADGALTFTARTRLGDRGVLYYEVVRR